MFLYLYYILKNDVLVSGHMYLANVVQEDGQAGKVYVCVVDNLQLRTTSRGDDQRLVPQEILCKLVLLRSISSQNKVIKVCAVSIKS